jgi:hypothetical protein
MTRADARIALLLELMDQAFDAKGWHGTTLRGALRGLTPAQALWRPAPGRHRIWDYVLHCAYWKYAVRRRLEGDPAGSFPRAPSNWPAVPEEATASAWRADIRLLEAEHRALRELVEWIPPKLLDARSPKGRWRNIEQVHGVAAHDLYHTGQIQLIKRLMKRNG